MQQRMIRLLTVILMILTTVDCLSQRIQETDISSVLMPISPGFDSEIKISIDKKAKLIICGEAHNVPVNKILKFQFLRHTYINNNVRYLIVEVGPAMGYAINKYLKKGDESILKLSPYIYEEIDFWRELKKFNDSVATDKVLVLGFDFDWIEPYMYTIKDILTIRPEYKQDTKIIIQKILGHLNDKPSNEDISSINVEILALLNLDDTNFQNDIAENKINLELIAKNKVPAISKTKRDKETFKNINRTISNFKNGNFFGQYGISHVNKSLPTLTEMLETKSESPFFQRVVSISPHYLNCEYKWGNEVKPIDNFGILKATKTKFIDLDKIPYDISFFETKALNDNKENLYLSTDYVLIVKNQKVQ